MSGFLVFAVAIRVLHSSAALLAFFLIVKIERLPTFSELAVSTITFCYLVDILIVYTQMKPQSRVTH
jgi:hypothetical protein